MEQPEEKAKELVAKFKNAAKDQIFKDWDYYHKQCALISVDEIITAYENCSAKDSMNFYEKVKSEINKL